MLENQLFSVVLGKIKDGYPDTHCIRITVLRCSECNYRILENTYMLTYSSLKSKGFYPILPTYLPFHNLSRTKALTVVDFRLQRSLLCLDLWQRKENRKEPIILSCHRSSTEPDLETVWNGGVFMCKFKRATTMALACAMLLSLLPMAGLPPYPY